ncbi:penicillin-binding protein activator LpoB [Celerinatantimonas sp. MCCC 1A17872]|uniref:penicillin-binding protein activator LpoB n=1 Tax=Celerinatantimonas sp. MCCC 1A17872 TaxID=3177514 RepID=UPI0038CA664C
MSKKTSLLVTSAVIAALGLTGCAEKVSYGDAQAVETVNVNFGSTDLQKIANNMTDSLLASGFTQKLSAQGKTPVIYVEGIKNKTSEHIDTESITNSISTKLLQSGKFQFVDMTRVNAVRKQLNYQNQSGMVDPDKAVRFGHQVGAQYMLYGNLSSIVKSNSSTKDVYYKMTMRLMDLKTGLLVWADETQIRKDAKRSLFGW